MAFVQGTLAISLRPGLDRSQEGTSRDLGFFLSLLEVLGFFGGLCGLQQVLG